MFPELNNLLNTTPDTEEQGKLTLLCDAKTDGSFLVHHFLSFYLKANCKVCFVALVQSFSHYNIVGQKLGVSLTAARERGQLIFLEALKSSVDIFFQTPVEPPQPLQFLREASARDLRPLYAFVREALKPGDGREATWKPPVLLVDDLSVLLSLGMGAVAVLDFIHYCRAAVCAELKGSMVALVHDRGDEDEENDLLLSGLSHQSHLILRAEGLATGFCKDVHGQLSILWRRPSQPTARRDRSLTYQYKIQDKTVSFFAKGLSPAVL